MNGMIESKRTVGLVAVSAVLLGCAVWLAFGRAKVQSGEGQLDIPLICAGCGHSFGVDYDGLMRFIAEAIKKGLANPGAGQAPVGFCPKCNKPSLYRAEEDPQTGKAVLPDFAKVADKKAGSGRTPR
jgi:hypothetical protein